MGLIAWLWGTWSAQEPQTLIDSWRVPEAPASRYHLDLRLSELSSNSIVRTEALSAVARELHRYTEARGHLPSSELIDLILTAYGLPLWGAELRAWSSAQSAARREARLHLILSKRSLEDQAFPMLIGESTRANATHWGHLVLTAPALMSLSPIQKSLNAHKAERLHFQLAPSLSAPQAISLDERGALSTLNVTQSGSEYIVQLPLSGPPIRELELLARAPYGIRPLAQLTFSSHPSPSAWSTRSTQAEPSSSSDSIEQRAWLLTRLDAERARYGLPALTLDPHLSAVAQVHTREMNNLGYFGHHSPRSGSPLKRLKTSGYVAIKVGENIARNTTLSGAHQSLFKSLGHRQNMLDQHFTHVGIGVLRAQEGYIVTQLFSKPAPRYTEADIPVLLSSLYQQVSARAQRDFISCDRTNTHPRCIQLNQAIEKLTQLRRSAKGAQALTPEAALSEVTPLIKDRTLTAWIAQSEALEVIELPPELTSPGGALALGVYLSKPNEAQRALIEVWGLRLSVSPP